MTTPNRSIRALVHRGTFEGMSNEDLLSLLEEPEMLVSLSHLERELLIRLGAMVDVLDYTVKEYEAELAGV